MGYKDRWKEFRGVGFDRHIELILSGAITLFAAVQVATSCNNNQSTSTQNDQLIAASRVSAEAADKNAAAAQSFADSARRIDNGVTLAANQLQAQAKATEDVRLSGEAENAKTLDTATQNSRADLRAYIVVTGQSGEVRSGCEYAQHQCVRFQYINVGRTPAVAIQVKAVLQRDWPTGGEDNYEPALKQMVVNTKYTGDHGSVIGTNIPEADTATEVGEPRYSTCRPAYHSSDCGHAIFGVIEYKDIFEELHETGFCMYFVDAGPPAPAKSCHFGNWFDVRPAAFPER